MGDTKHAEAGNGKGGQQGSAKGGFQLVVIAGVLVVTVLGSLGGALLWLTRSGRLPVQGGPPVAQAAVKVEKVKTHLILLEPLLVNLADAGGSAYLRVVLAIEVEETPAPAKGEKAKEEKPPEKGKVVVDENEVKMRDVALTIAGRETGERLLEPEGKERLKQEIHQGFSEHVPDLKIVDVMFTEFLVQR